MSIDQDADDFLGLGGADDHQGPLRIPEISRQMDLGEAAQLYAAAGWYVIPVDASKNPGSLLGKGWPEKSSRDPEKIRKWFWSEKGRKKVKALALHVGRSGAVAFDVDDPGNLAGTLAEELNGMYRGPFQATRDNQPGRGHYLFSLTDDFVPGNSTGTLGNGWGDVRGRNGVIIVQPSVHEKGHGQYVWERTGILPPLPDHLKSGLKEGGINGPIAALEEIEDFYDTHTTQESPADLWGVLDRFTEAVERGESRHNSAVTCACMLARDAAAGKYDARTAFEELRRRFEEAVEDRYRHGEWEDIAGFAIGQIPEEPDVDEGVAALLSRLLSPADLDQLPTPRYLIHGWLTENTTCRINGQPNAGKSLVALDWAGCIGTGMEWQGETTEQGSVIYIVAEGAEGFAKRKRAWEAHYGRSMENVHFLPEPLQIMGKEWEAFTRLCVQLEPKLIVFDTQRRVLRGIEENDNTAMGVAAERVEDLRKATRACCLLVHHTPKHGEDGAGAGSVTAIVNSEFLMMKIMGETNRYVLRNVKEKDQAEGTKLTFVPEIHEVPGPNDDPFMDEVTSLVLVQEDRTEDGPAPVPDLDDDAAETVRNLIEIIRQIWVAEDADDFAKTDVKSVATKIMGKSSFYRAWERLENQGLVEPVTMASGRPSRSRYSANLPEFGDDPEL